MWLVCLLLCKEEFFSSVFATEMRDMGLYEVLMSMSVFGFGMGTMLDNFSMCCIMLVLRVVFNMLVGNVSTNLSGPSELLFLLCFIDSRI